MKKGVRIIFGIMILMAAFITGCMPKTATDELINETYNTYEPEVKEWFSNNIPDAVIGSMEIYSSRGLDCTRAIQGTFTIGEEFYNFTYIGDTKVMLTDMEEKLIDSVTEELIQKELGLEYERFEVQNMAFSYEITFLTDRKSGSGEDSAVKEDVKEAKEKRRIKMLPYGLSDEEVALAVEKGLKAESDYNGPDVYFYLKDDVDLTNVEVDEAVFEKYTHLNLIKITSNQSGNGIISKKYGYGSKELKDKTYYTLYLVESIPEKQSGDDVVNRKSTTIHYKRGTRNIHDQYSHEYKE